MMFHYEDQDLPQDECPSVTKQRIILQEPRLALARASRLSSSYEFCDGPSILDFPLDLPDDWNPQFEGEIPEHPRWNFVRHPLMMHLERVEDPVRASRQFNAWYKICKFMLEANGDLYIQGVPLRKYLAPFPNSNDEMAAVHDLLELMPLAVLLTYRLFTTSNELVGLGPKHLRIGDRLAVLLESEIPVILRPEGEKYRIIVGCFVDGLMKGVAVTKMKEGLLQEETISIC
jgi:hypothetical protein